MCIAGCTYITPCFARFNHMHIVTGLAFVDMGLTRGLLTDPIFGSEGIFSELINNIVRVGHERDCE